MIRCGQISLIAGNFTEHESTGCYEYFGCFRCSSPSSRQKLTASGKRRRYGQGHGGDWPKLLSQVLTQVSALNFYSWSLWTQIGQAGHIHSVGPIPTTPSPSDSRGYRNRRSIPGQRNKRPSLPTYKHKFHQF